MPDFFACLASLTETACLFKHLCTAPSASIGKGSTDSNALSNPHRDNIAVLLSSLMSEGSLRAVKVPQSLHQHGDLG